MNRRSDRYQKNGRSRKVYFLISAVIVLIALIGIGVFTQLSSAQRALKDIVVPEPFSENVFAGMAITGYEEQLAKHEVDRLTSEKEDEPPEEDVQVEEQIEAPVAPEVDLSLVIAKAKTHVYTVYTDLQQGSGFLYDTKGDILTNAHVVKDASFVTVKNSQGQEFNGRVIGISDKVDIALVRVEDLKGKEPMAMETKKVAEGTDVFAIGSPENIASTSTEGKITGTGKEFIDEYAYTDLYEMNATIKPGSSGGPLIDKNTERILGINSIILVDDPQIGYAIPIYSVISRLNEWIANPLKAEDWESEFDEHIKQAHFEEKLIKRFTEDYFELLAFSLNDDNVDYYLSHIMPNSQAEDVETQLVKEYAKDDRVFDAIKLTINKVEIEDKEAFVEGEATYIYQDGPEGETEELTGYFTHTIVIDEFGDYQINDIQTN